MPGKYIPPAMRNRNREMRNQNREVKDNSEINSQSGFNNPDKQHFNNVNENVRPLRQENLGRFQYDGNSQYGGSSRRGGSGDVRNINFHGTNNRRGGGHMNVRRSGYSGDSNGRGSSRVEGPREQGPNRFRQGDRYSGGGMGYRQNGGYRQGGNRNRFNSIPRDAQTQEDPEYELELFGKTKEQPTGIKFDQYDKIPVEVSGSDVPDALKNFETSGLHDRLLKNIDLSGYKKPTPVQKYSIPIANINRDLMSCAQTGSGKTAAFLIPMINVLLTQDHPVTPSDYSNRSAYPMALVISPTRELTQQIYREARKFLYRTGLRAVCVYGGAEARQQYRELELGVAVLVATPGRLVDFLNREKVSLYICKFTVLDEADRMLDLGFEPQIREILEGFDMPRDRQTMMFSATFPTDIQKLAQKYLTNYIFLAVGRVGSTTEAITQELVKANGSTEKFDVLMDLLPKCDGLTLVFVETRRAAENIEHFLRCESVNAESIHGNRNQYERERALKSFRDGVSPILIATDVAARGLDVPNVKWVINYDLPNTIDSYVHRIGRTGRCGNTGTAISLVGNRENKNVIRELLILLRESNQAVPVWFSNMAADAAQGTFGGSRSGRNRHGGQYGGRDIRRDNVPSRRQDQAQSWRRSAPVNQNRNTKDSW